MNEDDEERVIRALENIQINTSVKGEPNIIMSQPDIATRIYHLLRSSEILLKFSERADTNESKENLYKISSALFMLAFRIFDTNASVDIKAVE